MNQTKIMSYLLIFTFFLYNRLWRWEKQVKQDQFKTGDQKDMYGAGVKTVNAEGLAEVRGAGEGRESI